MSKKQTNLGKELLDVLRVCGRYLAQVFGWIGAKLGRIRLAVVGQIVGLVIIVVTSLGIVFDTLMAILLIGDPYQVATIMRATTGVELFAHIDLAEYIGLIAGGVIMDIAILTLILWLGIYLFNGNNYFVKPRKAWLYASGVAVLGAAVFATSLFYMLPDVISYEQEIHDRYYQNKAYAPKHNMDYYVLEQQAEQIEQMMEELMWEYNINQVYYR